MGMISDIDPRYVKMCMQPWGLYHLGPKNKNPHEFSIGGHLCGPNIDPGSSLIFRRSPRVYIFITSSCMVISNDHISGRIIVRHLAWWKAQLKDYVIWIWKICGSTPHTVFSVLLMYRRKRTLPAKKCTLRLHTGTRGTDFRPRIWQHNLSWM
jgi:hypothetical protein